MELGKISKEEFQISAQEFAHISDKLFDNWKYEKVGENDTAIVLKKDKIVTTFEGNHYNVEYHVVYSQSYNVPVLYFRLYDSSGQSVVDNSEAIRILCTTKTNRKQLESFKWESLTQQMHPILHVPFFQLHPCHTETWMKILSDTEEEPLPKKINYLVTWLSFVGNNVGIHLPLEYALKLED